MPSGSPFPRRSGAWAACMCDPENDERTMLIRQALTGGATTLSDLVAKCQGMYPPDVNELLGELAADGQVARDGDTYSLSRDPTTSSRCSPIVPAEQVGLPVPHPHDYDWRFTSTSTQFLADRLLVHSPSPIVLLGAPSVYVELTYRAVPTPLVLVDWSNELVGSSARLGSRRMVSCATTCYRECSVHRRGRPAQCSSTLHGTPNTMWAFSFTRRLCFRWVGAPT